MLTLWQDLRYGARMLMKQKGITAIAVLSLALGIGANTALFSIVDAMLLRMLPVKEPERLVLFRSVAPREFSVGSYSGNSETDPATGQRRMTSFAYVSFQRMREQQSPLSDIFAFGDVGLNVNADGVSDVASGQAVSGNYFLGLGVQPMRGRVMTDEDDKASASPVAVISYRYWQQRFHGAEAIVGKQVNLNNIAFTIIGVTPPGFEGTMQTGSTQDVTIPLAWEPQLYTDRNFSNLSGAGAWWLRLMGRLKPGVTAEQARAQLESVFHNSVVEHRTARQAQAQARGGNAINNLDPKFYPRLFLDPGGQGEMNTRQSYAPSLYMLLGVVGLVLLIACANVANLLLARAAVRQKEIAIRCAMGAGRPRLVRQLLTESILLSVAGGAIGLLLALWGTEALVKLAADSVPRAGEIGVDKSVLGFTMLLSVLTGMIFGLVPAWQASRLDINESLKDGGKGTVARNTRTRSGLVVAEIALALILLVGAGLLIQSFWRLQDVDPGFNPRNVLTMRMFLPESKYADEGRSRVFFEQVLQRVAALPGVQAVGTTTQLPMRGGGDTYFKIEGRTFPGPNQQVTALNPAISHDYFRAMGIPLLKGRAFTEQETKETAKVVIINESFARTYFPDEDPLGKRLIIDDGQPLTCEIIGVTRDIKQFSLAGQFNPTMYMPRIETGFANLAVRTSGDPLALASAVSAAVQSVDKDQPVSSVQSMEQILATSVAQPRFRTTLLGVFAAVALGLAAIGIYGVMAYTVAQRTHEIGIRMALGAGKTDVLWLVVKQGIALTSGGIVVGVGSALALTRLLRGLLFGVGANDPLTFVLIAAMLSAVALLACWIPARRATKVDPLIALRCE